VSDSSRQTIIDATDILDIIDDHHKWFVTNIKSEYLDVIEGYYNILKLQIWMFKKNNSSHTTKTEEST